MCNNIIIPIVSRYVNFIVIATGSSLGALSAGRVTITAICAEYMSLALTIAIRYCSVRKQFGPSEDNELPVIEYQTQVHTCVNSNQIYGRSVKRRKGTERTRI